MKKFALLFRMDITTESAQPTQEQMERYMEEWTSWVNGIAEKGQLSDGNHFSKQGRLLKPAGITEPRAYVADDVSVAGYLIITAGNMNAAETIASGCPILHGKNTSVEIRELATPGK